MKIKILVKIFLLLQLIPLTFISTKSQVPCPDESPNWIPQAYNYDAYGIHANVNGAWRTADENYFEAKVDWSTLTINEKGLIDTSAIKTF